MMPTGKASGNAVLAKARALYGSRLRADDYRRLMACRTMTELAAALKEYPLYSEALAEVNPQAVVDTLPGLGHMGLLGDPASVRASLQRHWARVIA